MKLLVIPIQTVSDIITNSSSEVFILNTNKNCEEINNVLSTFTSGFRYPEVFSLKDYREWRKKFRNGDIEEDWNYPDTIFEIANGWFKDPEDEEDLFDLREDFLFDPYKLIDYGNGFVAYSFNPSYQEPIHKAFIEHINNNWDKVGSIINKVLEEDFNKSPVNKADWTTIRSHHYWMRDGLRDFTKEFLKNYNGPKPTVWDVPYSDDVTRLDGCVLVVSEDDNSIPFDTFSKINELFNGWNVHLG